MGQPSLQGTLQARKLEQAAGRSFELADLDHGSPGNSLETQVRSVLRAEQWMPLPPSKIFSLRLEELVAINQPEPALRQLESHHR